MPATQSTGFDFGGFGGGLVGGTLGLVGGLIQAHQQKKAFRTFRKRQSLAIEEARRFADERVAALTGEGTLNKRGVDFLQGTFDNPENSPLADQLRKSIRVAQESRGLRRSTVGAVAEARALGAFTQTQRQALLPSLIQFGTVGENIRQGVLSFEAPLRIANATGLNASGFNFAPGLAPPGSSLNEAITGGIAGFAGGFNIGSTLFPRTTSGS
jgi:hypothetical protein